MARASAWRKAYCRRRTLGDLRAIKWKSFDGTDVLGLLLMPPGYRAGTRIPLVVYCHGGPIGGFTYGIFPQFMHGPGQIEHYAVEAMAAEGIAVLMPMPRGGLLITRPSAIESFGFSASFR